MRFPRSEFIATLGTDLCIEFAGTGIGVAAGFEATVVATESHGMSRSHLVHLFCDFTSGFFETGPLCPRYRNWRHQETIPKNNTNSNSSNRGGFIRYIYVY